MTGAPQRGAEDMHNTPGQYHLAHRTPVDTQTYINDDKPYMNDDKPFVYNHPMERGIIHICDMHIYIWYIIVNIWRIMHTYLVYHRAYPPCVIADIRGYMVTDQISLFTSNCEWYHLTSNLS